MATDVVHYSYPSNLSMHHNEELERIVIGNAIVRGYLETADRQLSTEAFFIGTHRILWEAILELDENGESIDTLSVYRLASKNPAFILKLTDVSRFIEGLPGNTTPKIISELQELLVKRKLVRFAERIGERTSSGDTSQNLIADAMQFLTSLEDEAANTGGTATRLSDVFATDVKPRLEAMFRGEQIKVPTGWQLLDSALRGGIGLGELCVLGSKTKHGKSAFMIQMARQMAELDVPVYVCSREMLNFENAFRLIAQTAPLLTMNHFGVNIPEGVVDKSVDAMQKMQNLPLFLDDRSRTVMEVAKETQRLMRAGVGIKCVFVDYAQLMQVDEAWGKSRANVLETIMYDLKDLAMREQIAVVCLAQFNREGLLQDTPEIWHFEGSSAIEKAGNLILLWTLDEDTRVRHGTLRIAAARSVALDSWPIKFEGAKALFTIL